jgi:hypothetical protein
MEGWLLARFRGPPFLLNCLDLGEFGFIAKDGSDSRAYSKEGQAE